MLAVRVGCGRRAFVKEMESKLAEETWQEKFERALRINSPDQAWKMLNDTVRDCAKTHFELGKEAEQAPGKEKPYKLMLLRAGLRDGGELIRPDLVEVPGRHDEGHGFDEPRGNEVPLLVEVQGRLPSVVAVDPSGVAVVRVDFPDGEAASHWKQWARGSD